MKLHDRVECAPHLDCWIRGDRYGRVVMLGRKWVHVRMFRTGRIRLFSAANLDVVKA
jgi:hypothetical protein